MLHFTVLELRNPLELYQSRWVVPNTPNAYDLRQDFLTPDDFTTLEKFKKLLKPFKSLTDKLQGNANARGFEGSYGAVWEVLQSMDLMFKVLQKADDNIQKAPHEYSEHYRVGVNCAYAKLIKYFSLTDKTPIYRAAIVLHPAYKFDYFEQEWAGHKDWIKRCRRDVKELFQEYEERYKESEDEEEDEPVAPARSVHKKRRDSDSSSSGEDGFIQHGILTNEYRSRKRQKVVSELERFTERTPTKAEQKIVNPLEYLKGMKYNYPILFRMAMDIFSIPAMSAECEREFSSADDIVTADRNRLDDTTIECLELQKSWLNKRLVD